MTLYRVASRVIRPQSQKTASIGYLAPNASPHGLHEHHQLQLRSKSTNPSKDQGQSSVFSSATSMLSALRWKAANALTESLSQNERNELLQKLDGGDRPKEKTEEKGVEEERQQYSKSIAEAIVEARAQESQRKDEEWSKAEERIREEAEKAARERVESELAIQERRIKFEAWQKGLLEDEGDVQEAAAVAKSEVHPILGPLVRDLGYKKIYSVSPQILSSIPVWKKQRIYRHDRAKTMVNDKLKTLHLGLVGNICLHEDLDGKLAILDGQHRVGMMTLLKEKLEAANVTEVTVEVYPQPKVNGLDHAQEIFLEVNKAESVKLVDMPGVAKVSERKIISEAAERLRDLYPDMFKPSQNCRAPHLNIDNLRDNIFGSGVLKKHGLSSTKALTDWLMEQNAVLEAKYTASEEEQKTIAKTAWAKASKNKFYLGLDSGWYYS